MGYTHYWRRPKTLDPNTFTALVQDAKTLLAHLPSQVDGEPLVICDCNGEGQPEVLDDLIAFNGDAATERDYEGFVFPQVELNPFVRPDADGRYFIFCKTDRRPYDLLVCAVLLAVKHHFPAVTISSDGDREDWKPAVDWYMNVLRPVPTDGPWERED